MNDINQMVKKANVQAHDKTHTENLKQNNSTLKYEQLSLFAATRQVAIYYKVCNATHARTHITTIVQFAVCVATQQRRDSA